MVNSLSRFEAPQPADTIDANIAGETSITEARVSNTINLQSVAQEANILRQNVLSNLSQSLVDLESVIEQVLIATIAQGHVLLEGVPGTAKTTLCRTLATVMGARFSANSIHAGLIAIGCHGNENP